VNLCPQLHCGSGGRGGNRGAELLDIPFSLTERKVFDLRGGDVGERRLGHVLTSSIRHKDTPSRTRRVREEQRRRAGLFQTGVSCPAYPLPKVLLKKSHIGSLEAPPLIQEKRGFPGGVCLGLCKNVGGELFEIGTPYNALDADAFGDAPLPGLRTLPGKRTGSIGDREVLPGDSPNKPRVTETSSSVFEAANIRPGEIRARILMGLRQVLRHFFKAPK